MQRASVSNINFLFWFFFFLTIVPSPCLTKQDIYILGISQHNNLCFTHDCHSLIQLYQLQKKSSLCLCFCTFVASELLEWETCHSLLLYANWRFAYVTTSCIWWVCANIHRILNDDRRIVSSANLQLEIVLLSVYTFRETIFNILIMWLAGNKHLLFLKKKKLG